MPTGLRSRPMPTFRIDIVNEDFSATEERELADADAARQEALRGAVAMGADELCSGKAMLFGAEVSVTEDDLPGKRFVVTVGASPLKGGT